MRSPGSNTRYMNQYAMTAALMMPQNFIGVLGRASAKTTQFQVARVMQAVIECPGAPFVWVSDTYSNLHKNVIPSLMEGLRFSGWEEDVHFVIDKQPPLEWRSQMYNVIDSFKQVMTFYNGFTFTFVSLDRASIGAGRSYVGLFGDEVKYWPEERFTNIRKAVRGYRARYGDTPWYRSMSLTTDMPNPNHLGEHTWMMKLAKLMDRDRIRLLLQTGLAANDARRRYADALATGDDRAVQLAERNLQRWNDRWCEARKGTTYFLVASTLINADVLGEEFFQEELSEGLEGVDVNLLSIPQKLEAGQRFYTTLSARDFYQDGTDNAVIDRHEYGWEEDCSVLRYLDPLKPVEAGMDDGNMKSMVFGQHRGREYRILKEIYTLPPENERQLADRFLLYFAPHKQKTLRLYFDRAMNNYQRQGNDMAKRIKQAIETDGDGRRTGWRVQLMSRGQGDIYSHTEYNFFSAMFGGQLHRRLFRLLIDAHNCPNLKMEMENTPTVVAEDKRTGRKDIRKQKKGDKLALHRLPQESTNLTDAMKYLVMRPDWVNVWKASQKNTIIDPK